MFIIPLLVIVKTGNTPKRPSTGEWIHSVWHRMGYYSAIKRNELLMHRTPRINHKATMQKEIKQKKNTSCMILLKHDSRKCKLIYNGKKISSCLATVEVGARGTDYKGAQENFQGWSVYSLFWSWRWFSWVCIYIYTHTYTLYMLKLTKLYTYKYAKFTVCQLHLNKAV